MNTKKTGLPRLILVVFLCVAAIVVFPLIAIPFLRRIDDPFIYECAGEAFMTALAVLLALALREGRIFIFDQQALRKGWQSGLYMLIQSVLLLALCFEIDIPVTETTEHVIWFVLMVFLVGLCEETLFRGLMQNAFHGFLGENTVRHVRLAIVLSGAIFGTVHLINGFSDGISFYSAAVQALGASALGMFLGAVWFRTGKCLWYCAALHALNDAAGMILAGRLSGVSTEAVINTVHDKQGASALIAPAIYIGITLYLTRPAKILPLIIRPHSGENNDK